MGARREGKTKLNPVSSILFHSIPFIPSYPILFFFLGHTCGIRKFPGHGLNQSCSCQVYATATDNGIQAASATYTTAHGNTWILNQLSEARDGTCISFPLPLVVGGRETSWALSFFPCRLGGQYQGELPLS